MEEEAVAGEVMEGGGGGGRRGEDEIGREC